METSMEVAVRFSNIDENSELRLGDMVDFFQNSSNYQAEVLGIGVDYQLKTNRAWLLSSWQIIINELPKLDDELIVKTWPYSFRGVCGKRNYIIVNKNNPEKILAMADTTWAMYDVLQKSLSRVTEEDMKGFVIKEKLDMEYAKGKIKTFPEENYIDKEPFSVKKYCLDINNHVNNAWYIKFAEEYISERKNIRQIRVEYRESAVYGDMIYPTVAEDEFRIVVELRNKKGIKFAVVEFERKQENT